MTYAAFGPYPELALHIAAAQLSGLPGAYPDGAMPNSTPLHRLTNDTLIALNRDASCPPTYPRPEGKSCDEYPFASAEEGAFTGDGTPRGSALNQFLYVPLRILGADPFYVWVDQG